MDIVEMIKDLGFPICVFLLVWYQNENTLKNNTNAINDLIKTQEKIIQMLDAHEEFDEKLFKFVLGKENKDGDS